MAGSRSGNSEAIDFQKSEARKAEKKEAERKARIEEGMGLINQVYNGKPIMENVTKAFDWNSFTPASGTTAAAGVPKGFKAVQIADPSYRPTAANSGMHQEPIPFQPLNGMKGGGTNQGSGGTPEMRWVGNRGGDPNAGKMWALQGADGKVYKKGDAFNFTDEVDTGQKTGGMDPFYDEYAQDYLDVYQPEEARQFGVTNRDLTYNLARQGILNSTAAAEKQGEVGYQHAVNQAQITADASSEKGKLKQSVEDQKKAIINQLYATEDPSLAQNLASTSVSATRLQNPTLTPGAQFFAPALSALGGFTGNQTSPYNGWGGRGGGGSVAGASSSTGRPYK
jgi:hypothetical protein